MSALQTIFDLCIPKNDLAEPHQLNIYLQTVGFLSGIFSPDRDDF